MQFKPEVTLTNRDGWHLCMGSRDASIAPKNICIARAILQGNGSVEQLKALIAKAEGIDQIAAAFALAQFVLDYSDFITGGLTAISCDTSDQVK